MGVFGVFADVTAHPLRKRQSVASRSVEEELLYQRDHFAHRFAGHRTGLNSVLDLAEDPCECALSEEDFGHCQFLDDWRAAVVNVGPEEEALGP